MVRAVLGALWGEPRPTRPSVRMWRDRALVGLLVVWLIAEALLREDRTWWPVVLTVSIVVAGCLLWRRTHPLAAVAVGFGTLIAFDVARILGVDATGLLSIAAVLVLPYALVRWGSGREAAVGLGIILVWLAVTHVADPTAPAEVVAGFGFFLFSAALGAAIRFHANSRLREIEREKLRQRTELARELHDTVAHHVSAIAVQAQAGRALSATDPDRALATLGAIEEAASRTLEEMRAIVGVLRDRTRPDLAPRRCVADIAQLARRDGEGPRVDVHLSGGHDGVDRPVGTALHRIAAEAVANATRHAVHATRITVTVTTAHDLVHLTVRDDGEASATGPTPAAYVLVGMADRASLLGGTLRAGPDPDGGWTVDAVLPRAVPTYERLT